MDQNTSKKKRLTFSKSAVDLVFFVCTVYILLSTTPLSIQISPSSMQHHHNHTFYVKEQFETVKLQRKKSTIEIVKII